MCPRVWYICAASMACVLEVYGRFFGVRMLACFLRHYSLFSWIWLSFACSCDAEAIIGLYYSYLNWRNLLHSSKVALTLLKSGMDMYKRERLEYI